MTDLINTFTTWTHVHSGHMIVRHFSLRRDYYVLCVFCRRCKCMLGYRTTPKWPQNMSQINRAEQVYLRHLTHRSVRLPYLRTLHKSVTTPVQTRPQAEKADSSVTSHTKKQQSHWIDERLSGWCSDSDCLAMHLWCTVNSPAWVAAMPIALITTYIQCLSVHSRCVLTWMGWNGLYCI